MRRIAALLTLGLLPLAAQSVSENPAYFRAGLALPQADLKAFLGDRSFAPILEIGYDVQGPDDLVGFGFFASYLPAIGKEIPEYGGLKQAVWGVRFGLDMRFSTPIKGFTPYAGFNVNYWDGVKNSGGQIRNWDNPNAPFNIKAGPIKEGGAKFGVRLGAEYRFNANWGMSLDYNLSEWYSDAQVTGFVPESGRRQIEGVNPVHPSWIGISVQYRWSPWRS